MNAEEFAEALRGAMEEVLVAEKVRLVSDSAAVVCKVGLQSNESFPLRAYLSIERSGGERELAITIDMKVTGDGWKLSSDVSYEDGTVLLVGPTASIVSGNDDANERGVTEWRAQLQRFLSEKHDSIAAATRVL